MKAVRELNNFLPGIYKVGKISRQDVHFIVGKIREILEIKGVYKNKYPELNLFCNWCFHPELTGSETVFKALIRISKSIADCLNEGMSNEEKVKHTKTFISISANILDIPRLRVGLKSVLENFGIDAKIATEKIWWDSFVQLLVQEVSEKPLKFPDNVVSGAVIKGHFYDAFKELINISKSDHCKVIFLEITADAQEKRYKIHLKTLSGMTYILDLLGREADSAYFP